MTKGLFITFEGIDGCGKSTQAWMLGKYLAGLSKYNHVVITREPFKDTNIRKILTNENNPYSQGMKLAEMFISDRREHISKLITPFVNMGIHVVSDRYSLSTLAYQQTQGISLKKLLEMHKGIVIPDMVFIVDVPIETAMKRMKKDKKRKTEQKFEKNAEFIGKLRQNYLDLVNLRRHRIVIVDGRASPEKIFEKQIKPIVDKLCQETIQL